jgi:hypothetical protein
MSQYLSYLPSKGSGYGQAIVPRSLPLAVEASEKFAQKYCPHYLEKGVEISIEYVVGFDDNDIPYSVVENAIEVFGAPVKENDFTWKGVDYQSAKEILLAGHPWPPAYGIGPVTLTYGGLVDFSNSEVSMLEKSVVLFMLQKSSKIGIQVIFPIEMEANGFRESTLNIINDLPINATIQNFRIFQSKSSGEGYKMRKLQSAEEKMVARMLDDAA